MNGPRTAGTQSGTEAGPAALLRHRLLGVNTILNLVGMASPAVLAVVAIPILLKGIGVQRFGVLALAWALVGSFGIFDLGFGRALTQEVAALLGRRAGQQVPRLAKSYLRLLILTGLGGGALVAIVGPWAVKHAFELSPALRKEAVNSCLILAITLPLVVVTTGLRGILEAYQRFGWLTAIRVPLNAGTFLGPVALLPFTQSLVPLIGTLLAARLAATLAHLEACRRTVPGLLRRSSEPRIPTRHIWSFARWMAITNLVAPLMVQLDRFAIGVVLSASAVAFYSAPSDVITRIVVVPLALVGVLFPALATTHAADPASTARLFERGSRVMALVLIPVMLVLFLYAPEALEVWLDPRFVDPGAAILRWLSLGVLINSLGQIPFALIQAVGRPDLTGRLHLAELPLYLLVLSFSLAIWGLVGVAAAWFLRAFLDTVAMFVIAHRVLPLPHRAERWITSTLVACFAVPVVLASIGAEGIVVRSGALVASLALLVALATAGLVERTEWRAMGELCRRWRPAFRPGEHG